MHGRARESLRALAEPERERFSFVYLDPPYGVGVAFKRATHGEGPRARRTTRADHALAYDDSLSLEALVELVRGVCLEARPLLAPHATLAVHMDHRAVHHVKVALDLCLGGGAFVGEIIWSPGNGARGARGFAVTHQTLLLYARGPAERRLTRWNVDDPDLREPYADTSLDMHFRAQDPDGRRFRERRVGGKTYRYYADLGRRRGSVWTDLPAMSANSPIQREATGYPTQKPLGLLERLVRATTRPGEWVLDPMCGSGTTLLAAARLGRHALGIDASPVAIEVASGRLGVEATDGAW